MTPTPEEVEALIKRLGKRPPYDLIANQGEPESIPSLEAVTIVALRALSARVAELEKEREKDHENINLKADFIDATLNDCAAKDQRIAELEAAQSPFTDANPEARWIEDMENACPACGGSGHKDDAELEAAQAVRVKPLEWETLEIGWILGTALVVTCLLGFVVGMFGQTWGAWELAKSIGKTQALVQFDEMPLSLCARKLRDGSLTHGSQQEACAHFIERTLIHAGHEHLVPQPKDTDQ